MRPRHMIASSSPDRNPMETTLSRPPPTGFSRGMILGPASVRSPEIRPSSPSMRGRENPQMSASRTPTVRPLPARAAARLAVTEDFPTPPFPDAMATTLVLAGISVAGAPSLAFHRARAISAARSSGLISPMRTLTAVTPGTEPTRTVTSSRSWVRRGQPATVSATSTTTPPSGATSTERTMSRSTTLSPSSGSITPRRALRTASASGRSGGTGGTSRILPARTGSIRCVDRLPVFKALGDNTRYAIYLELARSPVALSTGDIAETLDLHPNTVRPHLERMRDAGLLDVEVDNRGTVGRPQHVYSLASDSPSLGLEPPVYPVLSGMLARVAAALGPTAEEVAETGRVQGRA